MAVDGQFLKALAKEVNDFELYDAGHSINGAWRYLDKIAETDKGKVIVSKNRLLKQTLKANRKRWAVIEKQAETETSEEYQAIYKAEAKILRNYCYVALTDLLKEIYPQEWQKMEEEEKKALAERKEKRAEYEAKHAKKVLETRKLQKELALEKKEERFAEITAQIKTLETELALIDEQLERLENE